MGSYVTHFEFDQPLADGERLAVKFHGAESAIAVWLNGVYIGYAADSFTPSEFDLTDALRPGSNKLAAQVFKWNAGLLAGGSGLLPVLRHLPGCTAAAPPRRARGGPARPGGA
uniref:beta-galactosidase n=1 Tax=uncultured Xylanimonas sp. TaxID=876087 RepID=A0A060BZI7_9MICO|nr:Glyco_hydro_2_N [uncultured Xylanimonas sp.]